MALQNSTIDEMKTFLTKEFCIPNYQREYSWEKDELDDFWNDLTDTRKDPEETHFFGQIVVHVDLEQKKNYIIDGQQRTTTSMIYLRTLQTIYDEIFKATNDKTVQYQSQDIESMYLGRIGKRHLTLGDFSNSYFESKILKALPEAPDKKASLPNKRLSNAYLYFDAKIRETIGKQENDTEKQVNILDELLDTFTRRFKVLYMEATKLEEAFIIFETLNARGKDLETADLLKNHILNQSKDIDSSLKSWNAMITNLDKCDPTKYIRNYWNATHNFTREKALYRAISKNIDTPKKSKDILESLKEASLYYHDIAVPEDGSTYSDDIKKVLIALKTLKAKTFYPVIISMKIKQTVINEDEVKPTFDDDAILQVVKTIECYIFRNFTIRGLTANSAETYFANIAKEIYEENLSTADEICKKIKEGIVGDDEFKEAFKTWCGSSSTKPTVRYILRKIHKHLDKLHEISIDNTEVHIEHIMPEDNSEWKVDQEFHDEYVWRLGNLCLLSGKINIPISNHVFSTKKTQYKNSTIEPNKEISKCKTWDKDAIEKRQATLADYAVKIWPL